MQKKSNKVEYVDLLKACCDKLGPKTESGHISKKFFKAFNTMFL